MIAVKGTLFAEQFGFSGSRYREGSKLRSAASDSKSMIHVD